MKEDQSQSAMIERVDKLTETISAWIQRAEEVSLRRYWAIGRAGENVQIPNFPPKTIYVDNSQNANAINIRLDGEIGVYAIPASGTGYVPCEGVHSIGIEGTGICYLLFINRDIRMVSNNQAFSLSGGLGSSSSDPLFASLTGSSATTNIVSGGALAPWGDGTSYQGKSSQKAQTIPSLINAYGGAGSGEWGAAGSADSDGNNGTNTGSVHDWGWNGSGYDRTRVSNGVPHYATVAPAAAGTLAVWTPASAKKFRVQHLLVSTDTAQTLTIEDGSTPIAAVYVGANAVVDVLLPVNGWLSSAANNILNVAYTATAGRISVTATGDEE